MKQYIPNTVTLLNLFCGCCATVAILYDQVELCLVLLAGGIIADYLDGAVARMLDVKSMLGKELDSLADMVTFGLLPGAILYYLLNQNDGGDPGRLELVWKYSPAFIISLFSALRLAKFNIDTRQTDHFLGLPTPSSTIFVAGILAIFHYNSFGLADFIIQPWLIFTLAIILSWLLVSDVPMFNLKLSSFRWAGNEIKFIFVGIAIVLLVVLGVAGPATVILLYILFNLSRHFLAPGNQ
ncbi:CDP-alcohol phosphatidyltransferase family protein [Flavilitoribacter nigricans]|uniref:CDP-diacylglycerol--serine O-phosphatidyltransferase n=1 Tax=Flavilitoribacter nigricans (strain ATCC 23147 / DSM 23189 / NBRC 102662 / NCIMB 1420 / SS-2) TaxID=1122177 RepID=A0A2D0N198_FLAN2|nr:CDP-alcohol phosphatidyltransferase family protein [Flavilitoribacter nigricans]PHN02275.1 CDP-diacylglycerol--serine O-phosphatidyltransferase [Flavilitoribacter nigricans DSM 23189 = NBRC 102662]